MRGLWRFLLIVVLCGSVAAGQDRKVPARASASRVVPPNVILITLDTTRADRMGFLGSQRGLTPNLDALAKQSIVFTRAYSQVPLTPPSHAAILTGTYPQFNHVNDFGSRLAKDLPYLPDLLHQHGYHTAAFVGSLVLDPVDGSAPGFDRGFDSFDAGFHMLLPKQNRYQAVERRAEEVAAHALNWLEKHPRGPFFLWIHFYDAHDPYDPPEPFKTQYQAQPYDGEIAYTDAVLGKLFAGLRQRQVYDQTAIAVMADHGEALGEHGEATHGVFLYDETIHVPLLVKLPGNREAGTRVDRRVSLVDVAPTLLRAVGAEIPKTMQGHAQIAAKTASTDTAIAESPAYAETDYPRKAFGWSTLRALRSGKYLYVEAPRRELYDQSTDPNSQHDVAAHSAAVADTLKGQLNDFRQKTLSTTAAPSGPIDPEQQQKLAALGYVASTDTGDVKPNPGVSDSGADPKDKIEIVNRLHDAIFKVENGLYQEAVPELQQVLEMQPGIPFAYMELGTAYTSLKRYEEAVPVLQKVIEVMPDAPLAQYELALALSETGDWEGALPHFEAASKKSPKSSVIHFSLAAAYARLDRPEDARRELDTTLKLEPDNYRANLVLGRMLTLQGKPAEGLPNLKKAVKLQPESPDAHMFLADAYGRMGQIAIAKKEAAEAQRLKQQ